MHWSKRASRVVQRVNCVANLCLGCHRHSRHAVPVLTCCSLVATWNVLNLENWQNIMYAVIRQTGYASSLFFVMWIIIGAWHGRCSCALCCAIRQPLSFC